MSSKQQQNAHDFEELRLRCKHNARNQMLILSVLGGSVAVISYQLSVGFPSLLGVGWGVLIAVIGIYKACRTDPASVVYKVERKLGRAPHENRLFSKNAISEYQEVRNE